MSNSDKNIPYIAFESELARQERQTKRLWIICIILIACLVLTNVGWIIYESQFETITTTQNVEQDAENGNNSFIGGDNYGEAESNYNH